MTAEMLERALKLYELVGLPKEKLFTDISTYVRLHYVYAGNDALILARIEYDNWFVELAVGNMVRFFDVAPFKTDWIAFARLAKGQDKAKWYRWERIEKLVRGYDYTKLQRKCPSTTSSSKAACPV